ncbi:MAG: riboflavin synthase [Candidatus Anoxymicrobium japonicum]|uniref:Riboflavin synthase n=1 Tax=Candidatus Anoxymicrobium japonicum TaxID=2013648 RepID=A0A2N3G6H9_9ACTN|nr:MAG: riboflavin synthase [Candidatus Anoxymicrobium japonicum]
MFTGIVEETGKVIKIAPSGVLEVEASRVLEGTKIGDSIAVSGVCLTVVGVTDRSFVVDVMPETLNKSTVGSLRPGVKVNLERALQADGRLGGHFVNGHVDGIARVRARRQRGNAVHFDFEAPAGITRYMVSKGSVAVDGVSLTVTAARHGVFSVSIIPHTLAESTLNDARVGTNVNIEVDIIAKYVEALAVRGSESPAIENALAMGGYVANVDD